MKEREFLEQLKKVGLEDAGSPEISEIAKKHLSEVFGGNDFTRHERFVRNGGDSPYWRSIDTPNPVPSPGWSHVDDDPFLDLN